MILSGGEPLLRDDVFELARYATEKGLIVAMGTNGTLITDSVAKELKSSGVKADAVSIDSAVPDRHDAFRGVKGAWERALDGIDTCIENGIGVQVNTTVTQQNYDEIDDIMASAKYDLAVRPVCAPQFMRIASQKGLNIDQWTRGCIAGLAYCRIYPSGEVTPCPYLPVKVGNIRETPFKEIWFGSPILNAMRDFDRFKGKCGACEYRDICGGCRARAYGLTSFVDVCGGLQEPGELKGDYLAEEPWCPYIPGGEKNPKF